MKKILLKSKIKNSDTMFRIFVGYGFEEIFFEDLMSCHAGWRVEGDDGFSLEIIKIYENACIVRVEDVGKKRFLLLRE